MAEAFLDSLYARLGRLDVLLHREILRLRAAYQLSLDEFHGLYISDRQVDSLVQAAPLPPVEGGEPGLSVDDLTRQAAALQLKNDAGQNPDFPWEHLVRTFQLTPLEQDLLLFAAAPDLERKYETIYAYLNNDVTRKYPTLDLAARLFGSGWGDTTRIREALLPGSPLVKSGLVEISPASERPSALSAGLAAAPAVIHFLLGLPPVDPRQAGWAEFEGRQAQVEWPPLSQELRQRLERAPSLFQSGAGPLIIMEGAPDSGQRRAAGAVCSLMGVPQLRLDLAGVVSSPNLDIAIRSVLLSTRLSGAGVFIDHADILLAPDSAVALKPFLEPFLQLAGPVFLSLPTGAPWSHALKGLRLVVFRFDQPPFSDRQRLWAYTAARAGIRLPQTVLGALADRFVLSPLQIEAAFLAAVDLARLNAIPLDDLPFDLLLEGARLQSGGSLGHLAVKVSPSHTWDDLVLPPATLQQVHEVADAVRNAHIVYYGWQFGQRMTSGRGLMVLFSGASGTGKTMTAGVIAGDLGVDLYKIDLSGVVSKYIGETEKNLDRVFDAARAANAILFFDEADALFGKRSEVKDAHDRYANIEIAYLLQKMESHEGAVILATNLSKNIDEAFSRRLHYVVEFPLPDEPQRALLWRSMIPDAAPLGEDVDFPFLARQFPVSGGEIRNAVLEAAFLAARDGKIIRMDHMVQALARLATKQGRLPSPLEFGKYYERAIG